MNMLTGVVIAVSASYLAMRAVGAWIGYRDPYRIREAIMVAYIEGLAVLLLSGALFFFGA